MNCQDRFWNQPATGRNAAALVQVLLCVVLLAVYPLCQTQCKGCSPEDNVVQSTANQEGSLENVGEWPEVFKTVIRREGDDGSKSYRIPGLAVTNSGTLIACFDIRWQGSGDLPADIDVGVMRSMDGGRTWGPMIVAIDYDSQSPDSAGNGVGDSAILVDRSTGNILIAALWSYGKNGWHGSGPGLEPEETGQLVISRSTDDGLTWEAPISITPQVKRPEWQLCFQGPGAGIQLEDGILVFPAQFKDETGKPSSCFLFSTDGGTDWQISPPAIAGQPPTSESQIVQVAPGRLLMTMRNESRGPERLWAHWSWEGSIASGKWSEHWEKVRDPVCMAGLTRHPNGTALLSSNNSTRRERMTIRTSDDQGLNWSDGKLLDDRPSGYSCLTVLPAGDIGILYEVGDRHDVETLTFARFSLGWAIGR